MKMSPNGRKFGVGGNMGGKRGPVKHSYTLEDVSKVTGFSKRQLRYKIKLGEFSWELKSLARFIFLNTDE